MLNKICLHSLNYAALKNARMVTPDIIELAAGNEVIEFMLKTENSVPLTNLSYHIYRSRGSTPADRSFRTAVSLINSLVIK